jgi:hypothetical protein
LDNLHKFKGYWTLREKKEGEEEIEMMKSYDHNKKKLKELEKASKLHIN